MNGKSLILAPLLSIII